MYRNDDEARHERANALIEEIAELERAKVAHASAERRLEDARRELATLQLAATPADEPAPRPPGITAHVVVFCLAACATYAGYTLLF